MESHTLSPRRQLYDKGLRVVLYFCGFLTCALLVLIIGYIFYPVAWVMGVPASEALQVGSIMATKLVSNEFVAMMDLQKIASTLSPRAEGIISIFLVSFANFSSIGIIAGAIKGLNEEQGNVVSRFGLKLVYGSTLVSVLSASIAALVL